MLFQFDTGLVFHSILGVKIELVFIFKHVFTIFCLAQLIVVVKLIKVFNDFSFIWVLSWQVFTKLSLLHSLLYTDLFHRNFSVEHVFILLSQFLRNYCIRSDWLLTKHFFCVQTKFLLRQFTISDVHDIFFLGAFVRWCYVN